MATMSSNSSGGGGDVRVCVTGGAGYIGSWLIKKLLDAGYIVHATVRNIGDERKAGLLRRLVRPRPGAVAPDQRLRLFEADLYDAATFAPAIAGCQFVFLIATPFEHDTSSSKYKNSAEAALDATRAILRQCEDSMTVRRVIYTSSVVAASPVNEDYTGFKCSVDESCWTPLDVDHPHRSAELCYNGERFHGLSEPVVHHPIALQEYIQSKLLPEKELLGYNAGESPAFEVVTLPLAAVGGDTLLEHAAPLSMDCLASPVSRNGRGLWVLTTMQRLLGSVPVAHIDDVCDALVFCMERPSMTGRFICSAAYPTLAEIVDHFAGKYPHLDLIKETEELPSLQSHSDRLGELGFKYKHGIEEILDGSVECAVRFGWLDASKLSLQG